MLGDAAQKMMSKVDVIVGDRYTDISVWAELPEIKAAFKSGKFTEASKFLQFLQSRYKIYRTIILFDAQGNAVAVSDPAICETIRISKGTRAIRSGSKP